MADRQMTKEDNFVAIAAGFGYLVEGASRPVVGHPSGAEDRHGGCSDQGRVQAQARTGSGTIQGGIAAAAEACSSDLPVAIAGGRIELGVDADAADKVFDMRKPYWDYKVLEEDSTMSLVSSFA